MAWADEGAGAVTVDACESFAAAAAFSVGTFGVLTGKSGELLRLREEKNRSGLSLDDEEEEVEAVVGEEVTASNLALPLATAPLGMLMPLFDPSGVEEVFF